MNRKRTELPSFHLGRKVMNMLVTTVTAPSVNRLERMKRQAHSLQLSMIDTYRSTTWMRWASPRRTWIPIIYERAMLVFEHMQRERHSPHVATHHAPSSHTPANHSESSQPVRPSTPPIDDLIISDNIMRAAQQRFIEGCNGLRDNRFLPATPLPAALPVSTPTVAPIRAPTRVDAIAAAHTHAPTRATHMHASSRAVSISAAHTHVSTRAPVPVTATHTPAPSRAVTTSSL